MKLGCKSVPSATAIAGLLLLLTVAGCGGKDQAADRSKPSADSSGATTAPAELSPDPGPGMDSDSPASAAGGTSSTAGTKFDGTWTVQPPVPAPEPVEGKLNAEVEQIEIPLEYPHTLHWSPDGGRVVVAGSGLVILNAFGRQIQHRLDGGERWAAAFSPDGGRLAVLQMDTAEIAFLDAATGKGTGPVIPVPPQTRNVAWSPDGRMLATVGGEYKSPQFILWEVGSGKIIQELDYSGESLDRVLFTADGQHVTAFGGSDRTDLLLWDVVTGKQSATFTGLRNPPESLALSPDGRWLASGADEHHAPDLRLWDLEDPESVRTLAGYDGQVTSLAFTPDANRIVSGGLDRMIRIWDRESGKHVRPLQGHLDWISGLDVSPDGTWIASVDRNATVRFWSIDEALQNPDRYSTTGEERRSLDAGKVVDLAISADGRWMVTNTVRAVHVWDVQARRIVHRFEDETSGGRGVAVSPDGSRFAWVRDYGGINVHKTESGTKLYNIRLKRDDGTPGALDIRGPFFIGDGARAIAAVDGSIVVWDVVSGEVTLDEDIATEQIEELAVFPDGRHVAVAAGKSGVIHILALEGDPQAKPIHELIGHTAEIRALTVSSDGRLLASVAFDQPDIRIWNTETGQAVRSIDIGSVWIETLQFLPGGSILCSPMESESYSNPFRPLALWNAESGEKVGVLQGHSANTWSLAATADGRTLFSASDDGTIKLWDVIAE